MEILNSCLGLKTTRPAAALPFPQGLISETWEPETAFAFRHWMTEATRVSRESPELAKSKSCNATNAARFRRIISPGDPSMVWAAKTGLFAALTIALSLYNLNCEATPAPEQSMHCCNTMRCHSPHGHRSQHSQDCCNTMPQMYAALGQPMAPVSIPFSPVTLGTMPSFRPPLSEVAVSSAVGNHSHDPPRLPVSPMEPALRI